MSKVGEHVTIVTNAEWRGIPLGGKTGVVASYRPTAFYPYEVTIDGVHGPIGPGTNRTVPVQACEIQLEDEQ